MAGDAVEMGLAVPIGLPFTTATEVAPTPAPTIPTDALTGRLTTLIEVGMADSPRSNQAQIGASEIGCPCPRRLVYRHQGVRPVNVVDPGEMLIGTGAHLALAEVFKRLNNRIHWFLVEHPVNYRNVIGTLDLFDLGSATVIDWKTTGRTRLARLRTDGPPEQYVIQLNVYAAGLAAQGYQVDSIALAFLLRDGPLSQMWVWRTEPDQAIADAAIFRYESLSIYQPAEIRPVPDRYCGSCPYYDPRSTEINRACPGR